jgi:hypothetical protein
MRVESNNPPSEFPAFCDAVRTWLRHATSLDPSLAAVADLVEGMALASDASAERELAYLAADSADVHNVLGASALLSLWSGLPR